MRSPDNQLLVDIRVVPGVGWSEGLGHLIDEKDSIKAWVATQGGYERDLDLQDY